MRSIARACFALSALLLGSPALADDVLVFRALGKILGKVTVYVTPQAAKVENEAHDKIYLCCAPTYDVFIYNEKRKLIYRTPYSSWSKDGLKTTLSLEDNDGLNHSPGMKSKRTIQYAGLKSYMLRYGDGTAKGVYADYVLTQDVHTDKRLQRFIQSVFAVPFVDGFPLRFRRVSGDSFGMGLDYNRQKHAEVFMDMLTSKHETLAANLLKPPLSYKAVPDSDIFVNTKDAEGVFSDLMGH